MRNIRKQLQQADVEHRREKTAGSAVRSQQCSTSSDLPRVTQKKASMTTVPRRTSGCSTPRMITTRPVNKTRLTRYSRCSPQQLMPEVGRKPRGRWPVLYNNVPVQQPLKQKGRKSRSTTASDISQKSS